MLYLHDLAIKKKKKMKYVVCLCPIRHLVKAGVMVASPTQHVTASQKQRAPRPAQVPEEGTQMAIPRCDLTMGHPSTTQEHPMPLAPMHVALHPRSGAHPQIKAVVPRLPLGAQI